MMKKKSYPQQSMLEERREVVIRRLKKLEKHMHRVDGPLSADSQEQSAELVNEEVIEALDSAGHKELSQINEALKRMEEQSYGYCRNCEDDISENRLNALPYAILCIDCAEASEAKLRRMSR